jgi:ribosome-binding protein aMBF1 (putative translation factor)
VRLQRFLETAFPTVERIRGYSYRPSPTAAEVLDMDRRARAAVFRTHESEILADAAQDGAARRNEQEEADERTVRAVFPPATSRQPKRSHDNVRRLRTQHDLSQGELAAAMGSDQAAISLIEGARSNPTLRMIESIARELDTTAADLLRKRRPRGNG